MDLGRAAGQASRKCFRPILMSVSTTMMGLVSLLMETSIQARQLLSAEEIEDRIVGHNFRGK